MMNKIEMKTRFEQIRKRYETLRAMLRDEKIRSQKLKSETDSHRSQIHALENEIRVINGAEPLSMPQPTWWDKQKMKEDVARLLGKT